VRVCESRATCGAEGSAEHGELYTYGSQRGGSGEGHRVTVVEITAGAAQRRMVGPAGMPSKRRGGWRGSCGEAMSTRWRRLS
jgi:hypothetical protein